MASSGKKFLTLGILNLTPDSFSDGGIYTTPEDALRRAGQLLEDGADYVDIGAESTRPGATLVPFEEEWLRLKDFLHLAQKKGILDRISIDTRKYPIMERATKMGVSFVNCVGPLPCESELSELAKINPDMRFIATHMHGTPENMQLSPLGAKSAIKRTASYFENTIDELTSAGFSTDNLYCDPGIGFGKSDEANLAILGNISAWASVYNIAIGVSRKGFLTRLFGAESLRERDQVSKTVELSSLLSGAKLVRTHDVKGISRLSPVILGALS